MQPNQNMSINIDKAFCLIFLTIYFVLPKSFTTDYYGVYSQVGAELGFWFLQRYALACISAIYAFYILITIGLEKNKLWLFFLLLLFSILQFYYSEFTPLYATIGGLAAYLCFIRTKRLTLNKLEIRVIGFVLFVYLMQYSFYKIHGRPTGSFIDANISGYYLCLVYIFFRECNYKIISTLVIVAGTLSLSRNFVLAVIVYEFIKFIPKKYLVDKFIPSSKILILGSIAFIIIFSYGFVKYVSSDLTTSGSYDRMTNLVDGSNYSRFLANVEMIDRIKDGDFFIVGNGSELDDKTRTRPHNAFLRAIYRYGLIISIFSFLLFSVIIAPHLKDTPEIILSLFCYYMLLNDFITGNDLVLLTIMLAIFSSLRRQYQSKNTPQEFNYA